METSLCYSTLTGSEMLPFAEDLVRFRLILFKEFPMLYDGDEDHQKHLSYLSEFLYCPESVLILAKNRDDQIVGISTAAPLSIEMDQLKAPFVEKNFSLNEGFYFRESIVLPMYRGLGAGEYFFCERERMARLSSHIKFLAFDVVERDPQDERKPKDYWYPHPLWRRHGFEKREDMSATFRWREIGKTEKSINSVKFWIKRL